MFFKVTRIAFTFVTLCAIGSAQAGVMTSTFDFTRLHNGNVGSIIQTVNGLTVTVTGGTFTTSAPGDGVPFDTTDTSGAQISDLGKNGIGVDNGGNGGNDSSDQLDNRGFLDFLQFSFSIDDALVDVQLESVLFTLASAGDQFDLGIDDTNIAIIETFGTDEIRDFTPGPIRGSLDFLVAFPEIVEVFPGDGQIAPEGNAFSFFGSTGDSDDGFGIGELTVSFYAPVPIPAALPLLLSGLAGFGLISRRRKQVA